MLRVFMCEPCVEFKDIYKRTTFPPSCPKCGGVMREDERPQKPGYRRDHTMI